MRAIRSRLGGHCLFACCAVAAAAAGACSSRSSPQEKPSPFEPTASILELMDSVVDPSADAIWESVASITNEAGFVERQPHTDEEWHEVRRRAITLAEATNLLVMDGRRVAQGYVAARGAGELDSAQVQKLIDANPDAFRALAHALHETAGSALRAIDQKDPAALLEAGGAIDAACEACHVVFWYPESSQSQPVASTGAAKGSEGP